MKNFFCIFLKFVFLVVVLTACASNPYKNSFIPTNLPRAMVGSSAQAQEKNNYDSTLLSLARASALEDNKDLHDTWVLIYPYTEPLISLKNKEKFTDVKLMAAENQKEVQNFITARQCFGVEIQADSKRALDIKKWQGWISQGSISEPLTFSKGTGFLETRRHNAMSANPNMPIINPSGNPSKFFYFAHACSAKPITLTADFTVTLEPKFQKDLAPLLLEWKALKN